MRRNCSSRRAGTLSRLVACCVVVLGVSLFAQHTALDRILLVKTAQLASPARQGRGAKLPSQKIRAGGYSLDYARRSFGPALQGSVAVGDVDGNGQPDLFVTEAGNSGQLLLNTGSGNFRDITAATRLTYPGFGISATFCDYDRSGRQSLFVVGTEGIRLFRNTGKMLFSDVTQKVGIEAASGELYTSAVLADLDGDAFPDLLISSYTNLNRLPSTPAFTFPNDFAGAGSRLYRNNGNGTFSDLTEPAGLGKNPGRARKAILADLNDDQRLDILLLRDDKPPVLYINRGGLKFEDKTWDAGDALTQHAFFDAAVSDFDGNGKPDLALWSTLSFRVLLNQGNATFKTEESLPFVAPLLTPLGFHGGAADLDENGFDDVTVVDKDGRLRAFTNSSGKFREVEVTLPDGYELRQVADLSLAGRAKYRFLAVHSNGRIVLLESQPPLPARTSLPGRK